MFSTSRWSPYALAALRIVTSLLLIEHATMKFFAFPAAMPGVPHPLPAIMVAAGLIEIVTGSLVVLGFFTRIAAFVASGEMAAAYFMVHASQSFWPTVNVGEVAILFCFIFLYIVTAGGGSLAIDNRIVNLPF